MKSRLLQELDSYGTISSQLKEILLEKFTIVEIDKNTVLYHQDGRIDKAYFIIEGLIIGQMNIEEKKYSCWFAKELEFIFDFKSFEKNSAARLTTIAVEKTTLLSIHFHDLRYIFSHFSESNSIARQLMMNYFSKEHFRAELMMTLKTIDRYKKFEQQLPWVLRRVPLGYIASYLNMTKENLSRVRNMK